MNDGYDYYECPPEIITELENWRRWAISRSSNQDRCKSIESRYRSTDVWEGKQAIVQINILEAVEIEKIISRLPIKNKAAIKAYHILRLPNYIMRRKLGERDIGCLMRNSWDMIRNILDKRKNCYTKNNTAEPSTDETNRLEAA